MDKKIEPRVPRGMRDILPEQMVRRQFVIDTIRSVFEEFGFEPLQTPAIELEETLKGKYGSEAERLIYSTTYGNGDERLSLRYDLSVPLCRVVAQYPNLPKPFKRYHIAPVWRADRPQKGRYREFYQCDADTVGSTSMLGDAETVAIIYTIMFRLGFRAFKVHVNNRKLLNGIGQYAGVPSNLLKGLYQSIDKLPKIGIDGVREELLSVGLPDEIYEILRKVTRLYLQKKITLSDLQVRLREEMQVISKDSTALSDEIITKSVPVLSDILASTDLNTIDSDRVQETAGQLISGVTPVLRDVYSQKYNVIPEKVVDDLLKLLEYEGSNKNILDSLKKKLSDYPEAIEGINELQEMVHYLDLLHVPEQYYTIDISMARGLEYYTGPIYETIVEEAGIGSVTGGGRYDNLVGMFTDKSIPATGTTIGIERLIVVMEEQKMFPPDIGSTPTQVLVTVFDENLKDEAIRTAVKLRQAAIKVQVYFDPDPLREQIGYAVSKGIPYLVIIGPDEAASKKITLRNLLTKEQNTIEINNAIDLISKQES